MPAEYDSISRFGGRNTGRLHSVSKLLNLWLALQLFRVNPGSQQMSADCFKINTDLSFTKILTSYRAVNTLLLGYKKKIIRKIAVSSEIHTKHITAVCGRNVEMFVVKPDGAYT